MCDFAVSTLSSGLSVLEHQRNMASGGGSGVSKNNHRDYSDPVDTDTEFVQIDGCRARTQIRIINDVKPPIISAILPKGEGKKNLSFFLI